MVDYYGREGKPKWLTTRLDLLSVERLDCPKATTSDISKTWLIARSNLPPGSTDPKSNYSDP